MAFIIHNKIHNDYLIGFAMGLQQMVVGLVMGAVDIYGMVDNLPTSKFGKDRNYAIALCCIGERERAEKVLQFLSLGHDDEAKWLRDHDLVEVSPGEVDEARRIVTEHASLGEAQANTTRDAGFLN